MSNLGGTLRNQDWSSVKLTAFEKNFYVEDKAVAQRSDREIEDFRREKEIRVSNIFTTCFVLCLLIFLCDLIGTGT